MRQTEYGFGKELSLAFEEALDKVREALAKQGFGVLTEIDVRATLKKKLDLDFRKYKILGACNPPFAYRALCAELEIGLLLPCNVIVYENDQGRTMAAAMDPVAALGAVKNPALDSIAQEVRDRLWEALKSIE